MDPTQYFVVKKLLKGPQNLASKPDIRLPIALQILLQLVGALKHTLSGKFQRRLLTSLLTLSFFAFLRVGGISSKSLKSQGNSSGKCYHIRTHESCFICYINFKTLLAQQLLQAGMFADIMAKCTFIRPVRAMVPS